MAHLEQRHVADPPRQMRLGRYPGVAGQQQSRRPIRHEQHDRLFIDIRLAYRPGGVRTQHLDRDAIELEPVTASSRMPRCAVALDGGEEAEIPGVGHRLPWLEHEGGIERVEHRWQTAEVIEMRVRRHDTRELRRTVPAQERHHDAAPGVSLRPARATVDQQPAAGRTPQGDGVSLPDVQETYGEATAI